MRKGLKLIITTVIFAVIIMAIPLGADIANAENRVLTAPSGIALIESGGTYSLTWGRVTDNDGYIVEIEGVEYSVNKDTECYSGGFQAGTVYSVRVKALAADGRTDSSYSELTEVYIAGKIAAPANIQVENNLLSWNAVENATGYKVVLNGVIAADGITATTLDLAELLYSTGDYIIKIKAIGNNELYIDSEYSALKTFTYQKELSAPENLAVTAENGDVIASWDEVKYADTYIVSVDGVESTASTNSLNITEKVAEVDDYSVSVRAAQNGNFLASGDSEAVQYSTTASIADPVLTLNNGVVSWERPEGANLFGVVIRNSEGNIFSSAQYSKTDIDVAEKTESSVAGEYIVEVQALKNGNYLQSDVAAVSYVKYVTLDAPEISVSGTTVEWTEIANATGYSIYVDERLRADGQTQTAYDFSGDLAEVKSYTIKVVANGGGWYIDSPEASVTYDFSGTLGVADLSADGTTLSWTAVLGAATYAVTVDGNTVATGVSALSYDIAENLNTAGTYTAGVYAEATGGYLKGAEAMVSVSYSGGAESEKTYFINITLNDNHHIYIDGVKTDYKINSKLLTLPSDVEYIDIVVDAAEITDAMINGSEYLMVYPRYDLTTAEYSEEHGYYVVGIDNPPQAATVYEVTDASVTEGVGTINFGGVDYYYHIKPEYYCACGIS